MTKYTQWLFCILSLGSMNLFADLNIAKKIENPKKHRHIVVIANGYNNEAYCERHLESLFTQDYDNFHVIYTDDASTDNSYELVKAFIDQNNLWDKVTLIRNTVNRKVMYNHYRSIHMCSDDDIVTIVDADDWLPNSHILSDINRYHENPDVWATTGKCIIYPAGRIADHFRPFDREYMKMADFRKDPWNFSHLKTFYAGLFKRIRLEDFVYKGDFLPVSCDITMMMAIAEQAREHLYFVPEVRYVYNMENSLCNEFIRPVIQQAVEAQTRSLTPYQRLSSQSDFVEKQEVADVILFSEDRPMELYASLDSLRRQKGACLGKVYVIYQASEENKEPYMVVEEDFPEFTFLRSKRPGRDQREFAIFLQTLLKEGMLRNSEYVLMGTDQGVLASDEALEEGVKWLTRTKAFAYYFGYDQADLDQKVTVDDAVYLWDFQDHRKAKYKTPFSLNYTLFKRETLRNKFSKLNPVDVDDLKDLLVRAKPSDKVGIVPMEIKLKQFSHKLQPLAENLFLGKMAVQDLGKLLVAGFKIDVTRLGEGKKVEEVVLVPRIEIPPILAKSI